MGNPFTHVEIGTRDMEKARGFYEKVFDWKISLTLMGEGPPYGLIETGTPLGGGLFELAPEVPVGVTVYIWRSSGNTTLNTPPRSPPGGRPQGWRARLAPS